MNLNPAKQTTLYGHHFEFCNFIGLYKNKKLPNKILLSGEKGIGKSTLAYHLINCILSSDEEHSYDKKNFTINPENKTFKLILNNLILTSFQLILKKIKKVSILIKLEI
jgi:DNA polymerase-3 subunit delta'